MVTKLRHSNLVQLSVATGLPPLKPDLNGILKARNSSRATMRKIRQNLLFRVCLQDRRRAIASGVMFPISGLPPPAMIASAAMKFSSVSVIINTLRLREDRV